MFEKLSKHIPALASKRFTSAIILAGGTSSRFGKESKQMTLICGKPIVAWTIEAFEQCKDINEIVIVARKEETDKYKKLIEEYSFQKISAIALNGNTRQESVLNGFEKVSVKCNYVIIHDAARCLVTPEIIGDVLFRTYTTGAAIAACKAVDTIKLSDGGTKIKSSPNRETVWHAQTPQAFRSEVYAAGAYTAKKEGFVGTDDSSLVERIGFSPSLVECPRSNIKITFKEDCIFAEKILKERTRSN